MADDTTKQLMVTVKRADGTFVQVPLSSLQKKRPAPQSASPSSKAAVKHVSEKKQQQPVQPQKPLPPAHVVKPLAQSPKGALMDKSKPAPQPPKPAMKEHEAIKKHLSRISLQSLETVTTTTSPTAKLPQPKKPSPQPWTRDDSKSLLEETPPALSPSERPLTSPSRQNQVEAIVKKLAFTVPSDITSRLYTVVQLCLKDLRSYDQTREVALRAVNDGGLGLTDEQTTLLLRLCNEEAQKTTPPAHLELVPLKASVPEKYPQPSLAKAAPAGKSTATSVPTAVTPMDEPAKQVVDRLIAQDKAHEPVFTLAVQPVQKTTMHDVSPPPQLEMGPVDEIRSITVTDFRRFASKPGEAAKRLQQKLRTIQEESYVLYLRALDAYRSSPLYLEYIQSLCTALANRKQLAAVLGDKARIQLEEIKALVSMEKDL